MKLAWAALWLLACSADHLVERGHSALDPHDLPEAERSFRRALSREPRNPAALAGLGWTYQVAGQKTAAFGAFDQCAKVAPDSAECLRGLASIAMGGGDAARARELLTRAEGLAPDDPKVQSSLALFDVATGDLDAGMARYQRLVDRLPQEGEYRLGLAEAQLRKGDAEAALASAEAALALPAVPVRFRALLWQLQARAMVRASAGREDPARCDETAPPVRAWLAAADAALDQAAATGVNLPDLPAVRRQVARRRSIVDGLCPQAPPRPTDPAAAGPEG